MVKKLATVSNNELLFKNELRKVQNEIEKSARPKVRLKNLREKVNIYCKNNYTTLCKSEKYQIISSDNFCMYEMQRYFQILTQYLNRKEQTLCMRLCRNTLTAEEKQEINEQFIQGAFTFFEEGFGDSEFPKNDHLNFKSVKFLSIILDTLNLDIVEQLSTLKPLITLTSSDIHQILPNLNMIVLPETALTFQVYVKNTLINYLTENSLCLFLYNCFHLDVQKLCEIYNVSDTEELKKKLGKSIKECIAEGKMDEGLKLAIGIARENTSIEDRCAKITLQMQQNLMNMITWNLDKH